MKHETYETTEIYVDKKQKMIVDFFLPRISSITYYRVFTRSEEVCMENQREGFNETIE